jgi:hypothetical protein
MRQAVMIALPMISGICGTTALPSFQGSPSDWESHEPLDPPRVQSPKGRSTLFHCIVEPIVQSAGARQSGHRPKAAALAHRYGRRRPNPLDLDDCAFQTNGLFPTVRRFPCRCRSFRQCLTAAAYRWGRPQSKPVSSVRGANGGSRYAMPLRIKPERGQVSENNVQALD